MIGWWGFSLLTLASMLSSSGTSSPIGHLVLCSHWTDPWLTVASLPSWHSLPCCHHQVRALLLATFCSSLFSLDRSMTDCRKSSLLTLASMLSSSGTSYPIGHLVLITHWIYPWLTVASFPSWHSLPCCHLQVLATLLHGHLVLVSHWTECESVPSGYSDTRSCSLIGSFQRSLL